MNLATNTACSSGCSKIPAAVFQPAMIQIHRTYSASLNGLRLAVDSDGPWTASVVDTTSQKLLYKAQRINSTAAKTAAVDFALAWSGGCLQNPDATSRGLHWTEGW